MATETQCAYLAGFFDGEGTATLSLLSKQDGGKRHTLVVSVVNTHAPTLEALKVIWGGSLNGRGTRKPGYKRGWVLRWSTAAAAEILRCMQPYLITKTEQALVGLEFAESMRQRGNRRQTITVDEFRYRETLRMRMRTLNGKGTVEQMPLPQQPEPQSPLACLYCGTVFVSYQRLRKYCSQKCSMAAGRDAYVDRHTTEKSCPSCGKQFTARLKQQYCSISCGRKNQLPPVPKGTKRDKTTIT